ncbi:irregular chiasm C-roughest protein [Caerostris extrusa]|uniref:Irregular chiasm C-roughest protein n=1 Tax=Caerostris extrusa TaxID=172846 RepID=A0AAV4RTJ4_CAEEX|nr:irregular chiasm C-roughest protein [Caerostris extrusa]
MVKNRHLPSTICISGHVRNVVPKISRFLFTSILTSKSKKRSVQYGIEGEVVKLQCLIASVPPPTRILWSRNSQHVDIDNNDGYEIVEDKIARGGVKNILIIHNADEDDFGQYNCTVWNAFGQDSMLILLKKQKSLPMLIILAGVIGGIVFIVSVTIVIILCLRRKSVIKVPRARKHGRCNVALKRRQDGGYLFILKGF